VLLLLTFVIGIAGLVWGLWLMHEFHGGTMPVPT
jgi:hypothetical protein